MVSPRGEVTPFASLFPVDEAHKAVKRVEEKIAEKQKEMDHLKEFIADNNSIINLVSKLPEELHHDIMVPFGKAAFFPGRLIHTNEFVVLLGEGYYAERTSKQTADILKRRGKALDSQVESLKANIKDLKAEASFFDTTASEAAEGLVEIREDYVDEDLGEEHFESAFQGKGESPGLNEKKHMVEEDDEYTRLMARLDELEREELAAENDDESIEDDPVANGALEDGNEQKEQSNTIESDTVNSEHFQNAISGDLLLYQTHSMQRKPQEQEKIEDVTAEALCNKYQSDLSLKDEQNRTGSTIQPLPKAENLSSKSSTHETKRHLHNEKASVLPEGKIEAMSSATQPVHMQSARPPSNSSKTEASQSGFDSSKAFTGSIVERSTDVLTAKSATLPPSDSQSKPSRPVSRFKMQRR
ncbi:unnamed protein product [Linum trigynum]|uniref:RNA polymerase II subunit 5-mediating protein homolog n=1 Tax=Linum trigynum TaxID=586398 RepID=A0AAV2CME7_9ROSI